MLKFSMNSLKSPYIHLTIMPSWSWAMNLLQIDLLKFLKFICFFYVWLFISGHRYCAIFCAITALQSHTSIHMQFSFMSNPTRDFVLWERWCEWLRTWQKNKEQIIVLVNNNFVVVFIDYFSFAKLLVGAFLVVSKDGEITTHLSFTKVYTTN